MSRYAILLLLFAGTSAANTPPTVTHLHAQQRQNSQLVDITYSVVDPDDDSLTIRVYLLDGSDGMIMQCMSVSGAVGSEIMPGSNKHIVWDAGVDYPGQYGTDYTLRVVADDGQAPVGFVYIPPGTFTMGSPPDEPGRDNNETQHPVTLTEGFYMSRYEVTEEWWYEVMGSTPTTSQLPKANVSWDMAVQFCNALSIQEGLTPAYTIHGPDGNATWNQGADGYRLPTEAEWEYACRAGSGTAFANGPLTGSTHCDPIDPNLDAMGWYCGNNTPSGPKVVGQKQANAWGLYDMHGNLWEWVWDGYRADYQNLSSTDPVHNVGPGAIRVIRGGYWDFLARYCRSAIRGYLNPVYDYYFLGFRLVRSAS